MKRTLFGLALGLTLGLVLGAACDRVTGLDGFALAASSVALGYAAAAGLGAVLAVALHAPSTRDDAGSRGALAATRAALGAALGALATYAARGLPLPEVSLGALDSASGHAGVVPLVVLPLVGATLGAVFAHDGRRLRP